MSARVDNSPLALTEHQAAALRTIIGTPYQESGAITLGTGVTGDALDALRRRGLTRTQGGQRRDGTATTLFVATRKGKTALERRDLRSLTVARAPAISIWAGSESYTCPELGRTCHRPGAYDAYALPSLFAGERRMPRATE